MTKYNYYEAVKKDIQTYLDYQDEYSLNLSDYDTIEELREDLYDKLWVCDYVTGNASGSYTFNTWEAEENLCHNLELLGEAMDFFDCKANALEKGAEWCDVTIRCYLLSDALDEIIADMEEDFYTYKMEEEEE